jgi:hypothetical protein
VLSARVLEKLTAGLAPLPDDDGCQLWTRGCNGRGYGQFRADGQTHYVHRVVWEQANGPIPDGLFVLHRCDNPPCARLSHLFLGTHTQNMQDCVSKGRKAQPRWAKLTLEKARAIRVAGAAIPLAGVRCSPGKSSVRWAEISALASEFSVHPFTVQRILQNRIWREPLLILL